MRETQAAPSVASRPTGSAKPLLWPAGAGRPFGESAGQRFALAAAASGNGRSDRIRTCDPQTPSLMRYQAALRSDVGGALGEASGDGKARRSDRMGGCAAVCGADAPRPRTCDPETLRRMRIQAALGSDAGSA